MKEYYFLDTIKENNFEWGKMPNNFDFLQASLDKLNEYATEGWQVAFALDLEKFILEREKKP